jgi:hypothetical protein
VSLSDLLPNWASVRDNLWAEFLLAVPLMMIWLATRYKKLPPFLQWAALSLAEACLAIVALLAFAKYGAIVIPFALVAFLLPVIIDRIMGLTFSVPEAGNPSVASASVPTRPEGWRVRMVAWYAQLSPLKQWATFSSVGLFITVVWTIAAIGFRRIDLLPLVAIVGVLPLGLMVYLEVKTLTARSIAQLTSTAPPQPQPVSSSPPDPAQVKPVIEIGKPSNAPLLGSPAAIRERIRTLPPAKQNQFVSSLYGQIVEWSGKLLSVGDRYKDGTFSIYVSCGESAFDSVHVDLGGEHYSAVELLDEGMPLTFRGALQSYRGGSWSVSPGELRRE